MIVYSDKDCTHHYGNTLLYVDHFTDYNSNKHWLSKFNKYFKKVITIDATKSPRVFKSLEIFSKNIDTYNLDMIHFGGSIKKNSYAPLDTLRNIREEYPSIRLTSFYGDVYRSDYVQERAVFFDACATTNASNLRKELPSLFYTPNPIDIDWEPKQRGIKGYPVIFAGNNYSGIRAKFLKELSKEIKLAVIGGGWSSDGFSAETEFLGELPVTETIQQYCNADVVIDDPVRAYCRHGNINKTCFMAEPRYRHILCTDTECPSFESTYKWFSNRSLHALLSGTPLVACRRNGMDEVLKSPLYYGGSEDLETALEHIRTIRNDFILRNKLSAAGKKEVRQFSFEKVIEKLMSYGETSYL